jgi:hypothetical protein
MATRPDIAEHGGKAGMKTETRLRRTGHSPKTNPDPPSNEESAPEPPHRPGPSDLGRRPTDQSTLLRLARRIRHIGMMVVVRVDVVALRNDVIVGLRAGWRGRSSSGSG